MCQRRKLCPRSWIAGPCRTCSSLMLCRRPCRLPSSFVEEVTLRCTHLRRIRSSIKKDRARKSLGEIWAGNVHGEGGRSRGGHNHRRYPPPPPSEAVMLFLVDILSFVPTENSLSSIESERERADNRTVRRLSLDCRVASGPQPTDRRADETGPKAASSARSPDGSPFPLRASAFV